MLPPHSSFLSAYCVGNIQRNLSQNIYIYIYIYIYILKFETIKKKENFEMGNILKTGAFFCPLQNE